MTYIKNVMLVIVAAIMGSASASLFDGWTIAEQQVVFGVSVLMVAIMTTKSSTSPRRKSRSKKMQRKRARKRNQRGKRRSRSP